MITVRLKKGRKLRLQVSGHSMQAPYGEDIVCAAVSALTVNTANSLEALAGLGPQQMQVRIQDGDARILVRTDRLANKQKHATNLLLRSFILGIRSLQQAYPELIRYLEGV